MRHFTSSLLACTIALVMLLVSLSLPFEPLRAAAVLITAGSIWYGWVRLRKNLQTRIGLLCLLGVGISALALACAWSGLNVVRFYLYNPAMEGAAIYSTWFEIVCSTQVVVQWCGVVLALVFVVGLAIFPFWTRSHHASLMGKHDL